MNEDRQQLKVAVDSLGCKLNQAEMESLSLGLAAAGYRVVSPDDNPDIYILNTCTVTHVADRKSRHMLRMAHRKNPGVKLVAVGCYAQHKPGELQSIDGVDLVIGNDRKSDLVNILRESFTSSVLHASPSCPENSRRTRSFIKVQDGCLNHCAYCIVPLVRSRVVSVPADDVIRQVRERVASGYKEVVLTGTEIGTYSHEDIGLAGLIARVLAETDIKRLRLSSLQPPEISEELLDLWRDSRLCPHFHLSLQSGSDGVLVRMKRRYNVTGYEKTVALIRKSIPDVAVTTDVIVGFPGETDAEFNETMEFCREMKFSRIHVFPFSPRPGTAAAQMPQHVAEKVKKERSQKMLALAKESAHTFNSSFIGRIMEVLWEQRSAGAWSGLTGNYIRVYTRNRNNLENSLLPAKLLEIYKDGLLGEI